MNSSENLFNVDIRLNQPMIGAKLTLINGSFKKIDSTMADNLSVKIPAGLYQIRIDAAGYYQEEYIKVLQDNLFTIELKIISAFPVAPYKSTIETHPEIACKYSKQSTLNTGENDRPNFFLYFGFYDLNITNATLPFRDFVLFNDEIKYNLADENTFYDEKNGIAVFSALLKPGLYFISLGLINKEERIIPLYIFDRKQTQFFIRCTTVPDLCNCRIFYSDKMEFDHNDTVYATMERLLIAYSNYNYYKLLTTEDILRLSNSTYLVALTHILHMAVNKPIPFEKEPSLELPDLQYMRSGLGNKTLTESLSDKPPILAFVMYKYSNSKEGFITAASVMDRVAEHLKYDLFWSSFTKIESQILIAKRIHKGISNSSSIGKALYYLQGLNPFAGKLNIVEIQKQVNNYTDGYGDEQVIAEKLNIPLTSVIRKYEEYKKVYKAVVKKEEEIQSDDFFINLNND